MDFPSSYKLWIWVLMGSMGTYSSVLFSFFIYRWMRTGQRFPRSVPYSNYSILGYMFLFASGLMCCGIAGPPGYALSDDPSLVSKEWILRASFLSNFLAMIGWTLALIGQHKTVQLNHKIQLELLEMNLSRKEPEHSIA